MNEKPAESAGLTFDFTTAEGHELAILLEHLLCEGDSDEDLDILATVYEKLRDANFLANWKRENVSLELAMDELMSLNRALHRAGGSSLADKFCLTGELRCCLITTPVVDRMYRATSGA
ncbi:MAG: hypothetical protein ACYC3X_27970 [Pirellulaceae bacterium]